MEARSTTAYGRDLSPSGPGSRSFPQFEQSCSSPRSFRVTSAAHSGQRNPIARSAVARTSFASSGVQARPVTRRTSPSSG